MTTKIKWVAGILILLWIIFGNPLATVANLFWAGSEAPWEQVDAFYYPDRSDLSVDMRQMNVGSVDACREWVHNVATSKGDPNIERGDYECGVACKPRDGFNVCRLTVE